MSAIPAGAGAGARSLEAAPGGLAALDALAGLLGVEHRYHDGLGQPRTTPPAALAAVLRALGADLPGPGEDLRAEHAQRALAAAQRAAWAPGAEPVAVAWEGSAASLRVRLPAAAAKGTLACALALDGGGARAWAQDLAALPAAGQRDAGAGAVVALDLPLPEGLPWGYHRFTAAPGDGGADGGHALEALVVAAPRKAAELAPGRRAWGVFLPVHALRSQRSWGCGDWGDLEALADGAGSLGAGAVATLPINAAFLGGGEGAAPPAPPGPFDPSPYAPVSRRFWNELFLQPEAIPEFHAPGVQALVRDPAWQARRRELATLPLVDYRACMALKRPVLEAMVAALREGPPARREALAAWQAERPEAAAYARFRAATERHGPWHGWPARMRDGDLRPQDVDPSAEAYHLAAQWWADEQLAALAARLRHPGPGLYLDLPLGVHGDGYDAWRDREALAQGASAGAPPDGFFTRGQDWGFAPLHPARARAQGYRALRASLQAQMRHAGALRLDHVMGLHRLYWVPHGFPATDGAYVHYAHEELYAILALESRRAGCALVGEDLGTVPPAVRPAMAAHGLLRMHVLQIEANPDPANALPEPPPGAAASLNTHDMPPFAAWWDALDVDDRVAQGLLDAEGAARERGWRGAVKAAVETWLRARGRVPGTAQAPLDARAALRGCLAALAAGDAPLVVVNVEDLWLEPLPQNYPGTGPERPSWRRKASSAVEMFSQSADMRETLRDLDRLRRRKDVFP